MSDKPEDERPAGDVEIRGGDKPADYIPGEATTWHLRADALDELDDEDDGQADSD